MAQFPIAFTSQLDAVNTLLASINESPVNDLETTQSVDVGNAQATLNEVQLKVLNKGWWFNQELAYPLTTDPNGIVALPDMCLGVYPAYRGQGNTPVGVIERSRQLYSKVTHSFVFPVGVAIQVDMKVYLAWEDMPEAARGYITIRAARVFQGRNVGSQTVDQITEAEEIRALATLEQEADEAEPQNAIYGNNDVASRLDGPRGIRRRQR